MEYKSIMFESNELVIEVNISLSNNTIWLSQENIAILYKRSRSTISKHIKNIYFEGEFDRETSCATVANEVGGQTHYIDYYNLDVIVSIGRRIKSQMTIIFYEWCKQILSDFEKEEYGDIHNLVRFNVNNISLDVKGSPEEETIWLNQNQIAILFDTAQPNVSIHIKNIIEESELDFISVHKDFLYTASDGKSYCVSFFNLDMINYLGKRFSQITKIEDEDIINIIKERITSHK